MNVYNHNLTNQCNDCHYGVANIWKIKVPDKRTRAHIFYQTLSSYMSDKRTKHGPDITAVSSIMTMIDKDWDDSYDNYNFYSKGSASDISNLRHFIEFVGFGVGNDNLNDDNRLELIQSNGMSPLRIERIRRMNLIEIKGELFISFDYNMYSSKYKNIRPHKPWSNKKICWYYRGAQKEFGPPDFFNNFRVDYYKHPSSTLYPPLTQDNFYKWEHMVFTATREQQQESVSVDLKCLNNIENYIRRLEDENMQLKEDIKKYERVLEAFNNIKS